MLFWRPDDATAQLRANAFWGSFAHFEVLKQQAPAIGIRWDRAHPGFCQHQKLWLVDAGLEAASAFVGGINLNPHSMVAPGHHGAGQNHGLHLEISGPVVTDIHHNFVQRWNEASERHAADGRWGPGGQLDLPFPAEVAAPTGSTIAQVQRTIHPGRYSNSIATPAHTPFSIGDGEFSIRDQYIEAIRAAREYIYLENQALSVRPVIKELLAAVNRGVAVAMVLPMVENRLDSPTDQRGESFREERSALALSPNFMLAGLAGRDADGKRHPVHVHAKLMIVDDVWATAGSCNLHRYSLYGNSELNLAFTDPVAVRSLRSELLAEHLGRDVSALDGPSALRVLRAVATRNAERGYSGNPDWEGIVHALDPHQWWAA